MLEFSKSTEAKDAVATKSASEFSGSAVGEHYPEGTAFTVTDYVVVRAKGYDRTHVVFLTTLTGSFKVDGTEYGCQPLFLSTLVRNEKYVRGAEGGLQSLSLDGTANKAIEEMVKGGKTVDEVFQRLHAGSLKVRRTKPFQVPSRNGGFHTASFPQFDFVLTE